MMTLTNIALMGACILPNLGSGIIKPPVIHNTASTVQYTAMINEEDYIDENQTMEMSLKSIGYSFKIAK